MKRNIVRHLCLTLMTLVAVSCVNDSQNQSTPDPVWEEATSVLYVDIDQIHSKSNIAALDLKAMLENEVQHIDPEAEPMIDLVTNIIRDPKSSGIAVDKPAYVANRVVEGVISMPQITLSVEIDDVAKFDSTLKAFAGDLESVGLSIEGDKRIINVDKGVILGYDSRRLVMIMCEAEGFNHRQELDEQMAYAPADMSRFKGYDAALYTNIKRSLDLALSTDTERLPEELDEVMLHYEELFLADANIICALTFEDGAAVVTSDINGITERVSKQFKGSNGKLLRLLPPSPIAILNLGINGEVVADTLDAIVDVIMAANGGQGGMFNEINIFKNVALGVISSIDGDLMLALSDAQGKQIEDEFYGSRLVFTTANATVAAEVKDEYIINNIETFGGSLLTKRGDKRYSAEMFGNTINIGQQDKLFYVGVNNTPDAKSRSAANEEWSNDVNGSYAYAMIDFNRLVNSEFGRAALSGYYSSASQSNVQMLKLAVNNLERIYFLVNGGDSSLHSELSVTLKDHSKNSLQQLVEIVYNQSK